MDKTYQPSVILLCDKMMTILEESGFFAEHEIKDTAPAREVLCDSLTEKFIAGEMSEDCANYNDGEFGKILNLMVISCLLENLKTEGLINSFTDQNGEEKYFPTKKGKSFAKSLKKHG